MCGIIAIILSNKSKNVRQEIVTGLTMLQHRGQGIIIHIFQSINHYFI